MATTAIYTEKELNSTARNILDYTQNISQVLKLLGGLYDKKWDSGMTTDEWFAAHGVVRAEGKPYTPKNIYEAWHPLMWLDADDETKPSKCAMFRKQRAYYSYINPLTETAEDAKNRRPLYTREDAEKILAGEKGVQPITRYTLCEIGKKWSLRTIMNGLKQGRKYDKEEETAKKTQEAVDKITEYCYIIEVGIGDKQKPKGQRNYEIRALKAGDSCIRWA